LRRAAKIDANQKKVVEQLRRCGFSVYCTHMIGRGFPDIVVGANNRNYLFEIKDEEKTASRKKLTPDEEKFFQTWSGQVSIIENTDDALLIIKSNKS
jgi:Holliday junction resolvase